ncbi:hypothetical protein JZ751_025969 [Albula glossodonta]|uniref:DDRGK domain-containing protein 1 n=1 Tax=Albula glossodonta TaxID=121402 RepID=A0A8T2NL38_9TELE|nr:hypothetical protein JZ751_025969 [Albula glossodonta]
MDVVLLVVAAAILILLILFAVKARGQAAQADQEHERNVAVQAAGRPPVADERGAGMPRRRRGIRVMEQRQAHRDEFDHELEEREERRRTQELREQERRKEEEKERLLEQRQEEEIRRAKEEQERREEEEYLRLKESFVIEEQGVTEELSEQEVEFIQYIQDSKVVLLEDLASHFGMRTQDAISRLQDLMADGSLTGVIDDRGKFIFITPEELSAVANFIRQRGRVSISELAQASNSLINLTPKIRNPA